MVLSRASVPLPLLVVVTLIGGAVAQGSRTTISIGALVPQAEDQVSLSEIALRQAVEMVNRPGANFSIQLNLQVERLGDEEDSFIATKRVCRLFGAGAVAILGPQSEQLAGHLLSMCDHMSVPVLETRWHYGHRWETVSINLHPHPATLAQGVADIVRASGWRNFAVIYEDNKSLENLQEVLKLSLEAKTFEITLQKLPTRGSYRHVLRTMRDAGHVNFVLDCNTEEVLRLLKDAQRVGMIIKKYSYFITSLDLQTLPLEDFRYSGSNITGLRLLDPRSPQVVAALVQWKKQLESSEGSRLDIAARQLTVSAALTYDALRVLARGLDALHLPSEETEPPRLDCDAENSWPHGDSLINYMKLVAFDGLTGPVEFDAEGLRKKFRVDVIQLQEQDLVKIGSWSSNGLEVIPVNVAPVAKSNRTSHHIVVTTVMKKPYTMLKPSSELRHGNDRFEGICVDLMDKLAALHHFNYTMIVNPDGTAGKPDPATGRWNGMIGDLRSGRAHFAIADLTITGTRGRAINFTTQWMSLGISLVYTKPMQQPPSLFSFLSPFSLEVWAYMGMAMVGVSFLMFALARFSPFEWIPPHVCHADQSTYHNSFGVRNSFWFSCGSVMQQGSDILPTFSPYEWENPHPCNEDSDVLENDLNVLNSYWFAIGSLMQQGSDIAPKAMSTRMIAGIWWSFTLIMISSYTANLAAFLTIETRYSAIESAEDLVKPRNSHIQYGLYASGSTADFFRNSKVFPFTKMWQVMNKTPSVFRSSDEDGIRSVIDGDGEYAYFMESSSIEYYVARRCSLTQVGGLLDNKGYGIGVAAHSPIPAKELSETIIQLQEQGELSQLKNRWWKGETGGVNCDVKKKKGVKSLTLKNVGGVFVCLIFGLSVATIVAVLEFLLSAYRTSREEGVPFGTEMRRELSFVMQFSGNTKAVKRPLTAVADPADELDDDGFVTFSTDSSLRYAPAGFAFRDTKLT